MKYRLIVLYEGTIRRYFFVDLVEKLTYHVFKHIVGGVLRLDSERRRPMLDVLSVAVTVILIIVKLVGIYVAVKHSKKQ